MKKKVKNSQKPTDDSGSPPPPLLKSLNKLHPYHLVLSVLDTREYNRANEAKLPAKASSDMWGDLEELKDINRRRARLFWAARTGRNKVLFPFTADVVAELYMTYRKWGPKKIAKFRAKVEGKKLAFRSQGVKHLEVLTVVRAVMTMFRRNEKELMIYDPNTAKIIEAAKAGKLKGVNVNTIGAKSDKWTTRLLPKTYLHGQVTKLWVENTFRQFEIETFPYTLDGVGMLYKKIRKRYDNEISAWEEEIEEAYKDYEP